MNKFSFVISVLGLLIVAQPKALATLISVENSSFEDYSVTDNTWTTGGLGLNGLGWATSASGEDLVGVWNPLDSHFDGAIPDGQNVAYSHGYNLSQTLTESLTANMTYTLEVDIGYAIYGSGPPFGGYTIQLLAGGNLLAEDSNSLVPDKGDFITSTVIFNAIAGNPHLGQALQIKLLSGGQETIFDDVRLSSVPIPPAVLLFGSGLIALVGLKRKKA